MTWRPVCKHARSNFDSVAGVGFVFETMQSSLVCVWACVFKVRCRHATRHIVCHALCLCQGGAAQRPASNWNVCNFVALLVPFTIVALRRSSRGTRQHTHICSHCVGSGSSDVRYWTRLSSSQVVVADARVGAVCFPQVLGVGCRQDVPHWPPPSTCALVDVRCVELGVDRFCGVAAGAVLSLCSVVFVLR